MIFICKSFAKNG